MSGTNDDDEGATFAGLWWVGMILVLMAALCGVIGKLLMKLYHMNVPLGKVKSATPTKITTAVHHSSSPQAGGLDDAAEQPTKGRKHIFLLGLLFTAVFNPIFFVAAYAFAAQSLLVPLNGMGIVFTTVLAPWALKEPVSRYEWYAAGVTFFGCVLVAVSGPKASRDYEEEELFEFYKAPVFVVFFVAMIGFVFGMLVIFRLLDTHRRSWCGKNAGTQKMWAGLIAGALGGTVGGNHYFVKSTTELLKSAYNDGQDVWLFAETYAILSGAIVCTVMGLVLLNQGLRRHSAVHVIPVYQSFLILTGSVSALAFFREDDEMDQWQLIMYPFAVIVTLLGISLYALRTTKQPSHNTTDDPSPEQAIPTTGVALQLRDKEHDLADTDDESQDDHVTWPSPRGDGRSSHIEMPRIGGKTESPSTASTASSGSDVTAVSV